MRQVVRRAGGILALGEAADLATRLHPHSEGEAEKAGDLFVQAQVQPPGSIGCKPLQRRVAVPGQEAAVAGAHHDPGRDDTCPDQVRVGEEQLERSQAVGDLGTVHIGIGVEQGFPAVASRVRRMPHPLNLGDRHGPTANRGVWGGVIG